MTQNIIREMGPPIRRRFHFAASAFSRLYGVDKVTTEMIDFCYDWALTKDQAPLSGLTEVDIYFKNIWTN